jgi:hypothetical protein
MELTRVEFEFTVDDMIDVNRRMLARSRTFLSWRHRNAFWTAVGAAVLTYAVSPDVSHRGLRALLAAAIAAVLMRILQPIFLRRKLTQFCREQFGSDGPFTCEVEIAPEGLRLKQLGADTLHEWGAITAIESTADALEFQMARGLVVVRERAFPSAADKARFSETASAYWRAAKPAP